MTFANEIVSCVFQQIALYRSCDARYAILFRCRVPVDPQALRAAIEAEELRAQLLAAGAAAVEAAAVQEALFARLQASADSFLHQVAPLPPPPPARTHPPPPFPPRGLPHPQLQAARLPRSPTCCLSCPGLISGLISGWLHVLLSAVCPSVIGHTQ